MEIEIEEINLNTNLDIELFLNTMSIRFVLFIKQINELYQTIEYSKIYKNISIEQNINKLYFVQENNINSFFKNEILDNIIPSYCILKNSKIIELGPLDI